MSGDGDLWARFTDLVVTRIAEIVAKRRNVAGNQKAER